MAVAIGNGGYASRVRGVALRPQDSWYYNPMVDLFARLIWPFVDQAWEGDATIDPLVRRLADFCDQVRGVVARMGAAP